MDNYAPQYPGYDGGDPWSGYPQPHHYPNPATYPTYPSYTPPESPAPPAEAPPEQPAPNRSLGRTVLLAVLLAALVGAGVGAGTVALVKSHSSTTVNAGLGLSTQPAPAVKVDGSVSAAAATIRPSVVTIDVASQSEADTGSGVIIKSNGYILTNNHVISNAVGNAGSVVVTLANGTRAAATIVGTDPSDDLAVIRIANTGLTAATFASSSALVVGQTVVAVGAPLGLSDTVTSGIVSSVARPVTTGESQTSLAVFNAVQTDAAINPGNSGGPLVNLNGDVVGINAAIATDQNSGGLQIPGQTSQAGNIGIGFAIPSDEASRIAAELITTGKATHAVLGVSVQSTAASAPLSSPVGAVVHQVVSGGPADKAGLAVGDVVTSVEGQRIDSSDALVAAIRSHAPGQSVQLTYVRNTASHTVRVVLGGSTK